MSNQPTKPTKQTYLFNYLFFASSASFFFFAFFSLLFAFCHAVHLLSSTTSEQSRKCDKCVIYQSGQHENYHPHLMMMMMILSTLQSSFPFIFLKDFLKTKKISMSYVRIEWMMIIWAICLFVCESQAKKQKSTISNVR